MPEPIVPKEPVKQEFLTIGETPVYLKTPVAIAGEKVDNLVVQGADKRAIDGAGSVVLLVPQENYGKGETGFTLKPQLHLNSMDSIPWDNVAGVQYTDENGVLQTIAKDQLSLTPPSENQQAEATSTQPQETPALGHAQTETTPTPAPEQQPETQKEAAPQQEAAAPEPQPTTPDTARTVLESFSPPTTLTIVGLKAYETRAHDLAEKSMQMSISPRARQQYEGIRETWEKTKDSLYLIREVKRTIWKQSLGAEYFKEKSRQYYMDMLTSANTPFAGEAIKLAEETATKHYQELLANKSALARAGTKFVEYIKSNIGMRTMIQKFALEEIGAMRNAGNIKGVEIWEREAKAVRIRMSQDIDKASQSVRTALGEKLEILDPTKPEHKPVVDGIKTLVKRYALGEFSGKTEFEAACQQFFKEHLATSRPDIFAQAELYSSSLLDAAESLKSRMSHEAGLATLDGQLAAMQVRLGMASMGEVTSLEPSSVKKGVERVNRIMTWMEKKGIIGPFVFNEATVGSAVALATTLAILPKAGLSATARAFGGLGAGALVGGVFGGVREYRRLNQEYLTHLREREAGASFGPDAKRRAWFERFTITQRSADDLVNIIQTSLYEADGKPKTMLTPDNLRTALATIADVKARNIVGQEGAKRVGLIRYADLTTIESQRTALDLATQKAVQDISNYIKTNPDTGKVIGASSVEEFIANATTAQTQILRSGTDVLATLDEPVRETLSLTSQYAPQAAIIRRAFPLLGQEYTTKRTAQGIEGIMDEFAHQARIEAFKRGVKTGIVGAATGVAMKEAFALAGHGLTELREHLFPHVTNTLTADGSIVQVEGTLPPGKHDHVTDIAEKLRIDNFHGTPETWSIPQGPMHQVDIDGVPYNVTPALSIDEHDGVKDMVMHATDAAGKPVDVPLATGVRNDQLLLDTLAEHPNNFAITEPLAVGDTLPAQPPVDITVNGQSISTTIPEGYALEHAGNGLRLVNLENNSVINVPVHFEQDGSIITKDITAALPNGWSAQTTESVLPGTGGTETLTGPDAHTYVTWNTSDLRNGQPYSKFWDMYSSAHDQEAAANGAKNALSFWQQYFEGDYNGDGTPDNIIPHNPAGLNRVLHYTDNSTIASATGKPEVNWNILPNAVPYTAADPGNTEILLHSPIFTDAGLLEFQKLSDHGVETFLSIRAQHGDWTTAHILDEVAKQISAESGGDISAEDIAAGQAARTAVQLGYVATFTHPDLIPTADDMLALSNYIGTQTGELVGKGTVEHTLTITGVAVTELPGQITTTGTTIPAYVIPADMIAENVGRTGETLGQALARGLEGPIPFLPFLGRLPLEAPMLFGVHIPSPIGPDFTPPSYPTYAGKEIFLTKDEYKDRRSPRLMENPAATLSQQEEITWYLSTLTQEDTKTMDELMAQVDKPIPDSVRAVVCIPAHREGHAIYNTLSLYANQVDSVGNPLNQNKVALVVYNNWPKGVEQDATQAEIKRFTKDHPDMNIFYISHEYEKRLPLGHIRRDLTNVVLKKLENRPSDAGDVMIVSNDADNVSLPPTYLSDILTTAENNPTVDAVTGRYDFPAEAYSRFPVLFASERAWQILDAIIRYNENGGVAGLNGANSSIRAGTLAAIGGYNPKSELGEDLEVGWMISAARDYDAKAISFHPTLTVYTDPRRAIYKYMQGAGLVDRYDDFASNQETFRDIYGQKWQNMAAKAQETYSRDKLENQLTRVYTYLYPKLKQSKPETFDLYFNRAMKFIGVDHEIRNGKVVIVDDAVLRAGIRAELGPDAAGKQVADELSPEIQPLQETHDQIGTLTSPEVTTNATSDALQAIHDKKEAYETPAETLPQTVQTPVTEQMSETTQASVAETPAVSEEPGGKPRIFQSAEELGATPPLASPEISQTPIESGQAPIESGQTLTASEQEQTQTPETLSATVETPPQQEAAPQQELVPDTLSDRIPYVLARTKEAAAVVTLTPTELLDYLRTNVDINGVRITNGAVVVEGNTVKLANMKTRLPTGGEAQFSLTLAQTDPAVGLVPIEDSLDLKLPFFAKLLEPTIRKNLRNFNGYLAGYVDKRIDPAWQTKGLALAGDTIELRFGKKAA